MPSEWPMKSIYNHTQTSLTKVIALLTTLEANVVRHNRMRFPQVTTRDGRC